MSESLSVEKSSVPDADLNYPIFGYKDAFTLGLVEGITEFLPISSTGHLILTNYFLGLNQEVPILDAKGQPIWAEPPSAENPQGNPLTVKGAIDAYSIIIQGGAIAAVTILYWSKILSILLGLLGKSREGLLLGRNLVTALGPAVVLGLALEEIIDTYLFHYDTVIVALFGGGVLMLVTEQWCHRRKKNSSPPIPEEGPDLHELSLGQALLIGFLQCVALWPGMSRSMMALVGGYAVGLNPRRAAEFSFLLGLLTLTGAATYKGAQVGPHIVEAFGWRPVLFGGTVAAVSAAIAVSWMVSYLTRHGLALFAWYRIGLAGLMLLLIA